MRGRDQFIEEYARHHRDYRNQVIHMVCIPLIFVATIAIGWAVPIGRLIPGVATEVARWINLSTLASIPVLVFYARLGWSSFVIGLAWTVPSLAISAIGQASAAPLLWISLVVWIVSWAGQFYGHKLEGSKPSFTDDLVFLLIGPLFVNDKFSRLLKTGTILSHSDVKTLTSVTAER